MTPRIFLFVAALSVASSASFATEFHVSESGNDANTGTTRAQAFRTIQKGVDALKTGDALVIGPGEYAESVQRANLGGPEAVTTIRAEIPGTVLLRGDVPAPTFSKVDGFRFVYQASFDGDPQALKEIDTLSIIERRPDVAALEYEPGTFHYDQNTKTLSMSTTDLRPPTAHHYSVCVTPTSGLFLDKPRRVVVEGLAATGFYKASLGGHDRGRLNAWGFSMRFPKECVFRDCVSYLNAAAIILDQGESGVIEGCAAYGNRSFYHMDGGGIIAVKPGGDEIRDCVSFLNRHRGIEFYLNSHVQSKLLRNLAWGNHQVDIQMKGGDSYVAERCAGLCDWRSEVRFHYLSHCLMKDIPPPLKQHLDRRSDNIVFAHEKDLDLQLEFADPDHHDYRLQATSRFRGKAKDGGDLGPHPYEPNVFYVKANGDDQQNGLSVQGAWKTLDRAVSGLKAGDTLYVEGGIYFFNNPIAPGTKGEAPVVIRGRGADPVIVERSVTVGAASGIRFERLRFKESVKVEAARRISFDNCQFLAPDNPLVLSDCDDVELTHCLFARGAPRMDDCGGARLSGNLFTAPVWANETSVTYSDYNGYASAEAGWIVDGNVTPLEDLRKRHDGHSKVVAADIDVENDGASLSDPVSVSAGGPLGTGLGCFSFTGSFNPKLKLVGPFVHSVGDTTANIEWWTSIPAKSRIAWGPTGGEEKTETTEGPCFVTYSLTGLKPGTSYALSILGLTPIERVNQLGVAGITPKKASVSFKTAPGPLKKRTFHVSPAGDDANTGLAPDQAWRSVNKAASAVNAGDTVVIAGGVYREMVRVRATGDDGKPITFKAVPGDRVVFDGDDRNLNAAFDVRHKKSIHIDGFHFRRFGKKPSSASDWMGYPGYGVVTLYHSPGASVTRCLMDGRWTSYSARFVVGKHSPDILIKNCVATTGFHNLSVSQAENLRVENCVLIRPMTLQAAFGGGPAYFRNNIITDNIPVKENVPLFETGHAENFHLENNCFYLRRHPESERKENVFRFFGDEELGDEPLKRMATVSKYDKMRGESRTLFANPMFAGANDLDVKDSDGQPARYVVDRFMKSAHLRVEPDDELSISDFFTTNPELIKRGIGLQPDAFEK